MDKIYTVTGIPSCYPNGTSACLGWRKKFKDAENDVINDKGNINEAMYYTYVVIECFSEGLWHGVGVKEVWYIWNDESGKYERTSKPEEWKPITGWAMS